MAAIPTNFTTALSTGTDSDLPFSVIGAPAPGQWLSFFLPAGRSGQLGLTVVPEDSLMEAVKQEISYINDFTGGEQLTGTAKFLIGTAVKTTESPTGFVYRATDELDPARGYWGTVCSTDTAGEKIISLGDKVIHDVLAEYYSRFENAYVQSVVEAIGLNVAPIPSIRSFLNSSSTDVTESIDKISPFVFPWPSSWPAGLGEGSGVVLVKLVSMKVDHPMSVGEFAEGATLAFTGLV